MIDVNVSHLNMSVKAYEETQILSQPSVPVLASFSSVALPDVGLRGGEGGGGGPHRGHRPTTTTASTLPPPSSVRHRGVYIRAVLRLLEAITICHGYVQAVREGKIEGDPELATAIHAALNLVPTVDTASFLTLFNGHVQDLLMILYLAGLTKTQLVMADKVNALLQ